jgi:beta-lactamase superfamily II metal-dependent hydrolase
MRTFLSILAVIALLAGARSVEARDAESTRWTMLAVTPREDVADSHLLRLPGGLTVLIDAGKLGDSPQAVLNQLKAEKVTDLDLVIISHFHIDHYGALTELIDAGIRIKRVALNVPDRAAADPEKPWGCDLNHVNEVLARLRASDIPYFTPKIGERLLETKTPRGDLVSLDVVTLYDGLNTPIGRTDVNDTSMIVRLSHGRTRALFTGDLNHALGAWLATSDFDLKADLLKVPHHGTEGVAPNEFFDRVGAKAALVPSPKPLWESARSLRVRNYFSERNIPVYVSALRGKVTAILAADGYCIETER